MIDGDDAASKNAVRIIGKTWGGPRPRRKSRLFGRLLDAFLDAAAERQRTKGHGRAKDRQRQADLGCRGTRSIFP